MIYLVALFASLLLTAQLSSREKINIGVNGAYISKPKMMWLCLLPLFLLLAFRWNVGADSVYGSTYTIAYHNAAVGLNSVGKVVFEPGYYLLTPREHNGKWYMLFKQNGKVSYIIPTYDRGLVPEMFYETHIPKPKLTPSQKIHMGFLSFLGKFDGSKRRDPVKSYMEINDLENYFVSIVIYYGAHKYSTIFRTIRL